MDTVSVNKFRDHLKSFVEQVVSQHAPIKVTRRAGEDFVVVSADDWERDQETLYVLQNSDLMRQIAASIGTIKGGKGINQQPGKLMRSLVFEGTTWAAYEELRQKDKKLHKALCWVLKEMLRNDPATGTGKPEPLKHTLSGLWSRRISQKDRVIYKYDSKYIYIFAIGGHYDQF